jgi:anion-transporting  ArsA/GET3 family ATPase
LAVSPFDRRFLFVTGKGGVGKTTIAASLARGAARAGRRVLLATTDPAPHAELLPGARFGPDPQAYGERLFTVLLEPQAALKEYGQLLIKPRLARQALFENRYMQGFLAAVPGLPEWAVLGKAWYHTTEVEAGAPRFDSVIFDAPATGHGFEMLRLPRVITEVAPKGLLRRDAELAWEMLSDPARSAIVVVTLPEELPTNETLSLCERITAELGLPVGVLVQNRVPEVMFSPAERDALAALVDVEARSDAERAIGVAAAHAIRERALEQSRTRLGELGVPLVELPDLETSDVPLIDTLAARLISAG